MNLLTKLKPMKRILCTFDYGKNCMTGFATVSRNVISEIKKHFGDKLLIDIVAVNYFGEDYTEYDGTVTITSGKLGQKKMGGSKDLEEGDSYGRFAFLGKLSQNDYDALFIIGDLATYIHVIPFIRCIKFLKKAHNQKSFKTIMYFPVDGPIHKVLTNDTYDQNHIDDMIKSWGEVAEPCKSFFAKDLNQVEQLTHIDTIVTYTEFGRKEILKIDPSIVTKLKYVYHGINLKDFFPIDKKEIKPFRDEYFGKNADKYIVGVINRNQFRKDIPTSILGFIEAKKNWNDLGLPKPFLYLHMRPNDYMGWNLPALLAFTDLVEGEDYMFSKGDDNGQVDVQTLNKIYNSIDVYLSTATGGGWELVSTEMFACKIPCIQPNHTSLAETGRDGRAYLLTEFLPIVNTNDCIIRSMCHYEEVGEKILNAALDNAYRKDEVKKMVDNAYNWVIKLTWKEICKKWIDIFEKI